MTIRSKLIFGFVIIGFFVIVYSTYSINTLLSNKDDLVLQQKRVTQLLIAKDVLQINTDLSLIGMEALIDRDEGDISEDRLNSFSKLFKKFDEIRPEFLNHANNEEEKKKILEISKELVSLKPLYTQKLRELIKEEASYEEFEKFDNEVDMISIALSEDIQELVKMAKADMQESKDSMNKSIDDSIYITIIVSAIILISLIVVSVSIIYSIKALLNMAIKTISDSSDEIVDASSLISNSSDTLSQKSTSQAALVEQVSASIEEAYSSITQNTQSAQEANELSQDANRSAQGGFEHIQNLSESMIEINKSSEKIANIIKAIDEIAFQTNLLALNAAVEAARAGEHGLGFAVVAEEVRSLAGRSAEAAKETADIIDNSVEQVKNGTKITDITNQSFDEILTKISSTSKLINEITISSAEQNETVKQINISLSTVDTNTQTIATSSEELSATAKELNRQAILLTDTIKDVSSKIGF
jgi:methyl-accepting chemotaxis protein/methyl-accepting chemotaxis protein-2 (aspartate sensor receptor)